MLRRALVATLIATLLSLPAQAVAQTTKRQFGRVACPAATSGGVPTSATVSREVTNSNVWTVLTTPALPMAGVPLTTAPFIDLTRVTGTSYRYRCDYINLAGTASSAPVPTGGQVFLDIDVPLPGTAVFDIITQ